MNAPSSRKRYLEENPDVKAFPMDPWAHWKSWGSNEGRPWPPCTEEEKHMNNDSSRQKYLDDNIDVKAFPMDPWDHWVGWGSNEGRSWPM